MLFLTHALIYHPHPTHTINKYPGMIMPMYKIYDKCPVWMLTTLLLNIYDKYTHSTATNTNTHITQTLWLHTHMHTLFSQTPSTHTILSHTLITHNTATNSNYTEGWGSGWCLTEVLILKASYLHKDWWIQGNKLINKPSKCSRIQFFTLTQTLTLDALSSSPSRKQDARAHTPFCFLPLQ